MVVVRCVARLLVLLSAFGGFAADGQTFAIRQAYPKRPVLTAYLDIVDTGGQPAAGLTVADFRAVFAPGSAPVGSSTNEAYVGCVPIHRRHKLEQQDTIRVDDSELSVYFEES